MNSALRLLNVLLTCVVLTGCVSSREMVPKNIATAKKTNKSISISVSSKPVGSMEFGVETRNKGITEAIQTTIEEQGIFSQVIRSGNADYKLCVQFVKISPPPGIFLEVTTKCEMIWKLKQVSSDKIVWQEQINSRCTIPFGEHPIGAMRLRRANLGSIRENIKIGLEHISANSL